MSPSDISLYAILQQNKAPVKWRGKIDAVKISRISLAFKALRELGPRQLGLFALYQAGLKTGYFRWQTRNRGQWTVGRGQLLQLPDPDSIQAIIGPGGLADLQAEANEIVAGQIRLFAGQPVPLDLTPPGELTHWSTFKPASLPHDIKFTWELARFGWAFTLSRAYHLTGDECYPAAFWRYFEIFQQANPANRGPNWESAQEVALRILAFTFAAQVFAASQHSTEPRTSHLAHSIAAHADRIPPTLIDARAQNNNHLLSEAAGLITAALALPDHPSAQYWSRLGWKWFHWGLERQIAADGSYIQQSTNYHRLMLQLALWVFRVLKAEGRRLKDESAPAEPLPPNLQLATQWLIALTDPESGRAPNLGSNDGAYILPLTTRPFDDYRPVLQAASLAFLGKPAFEPGPWDEMSLWLPAASHQPQAAPRTSHFALRTLPTIHSPLSWASLRAAKFHGRPGHADQLHLDLWWRGLNIAQDAGTYLYNAEPPWDNALTHTAVHNTITIDGQEQMTRAGRFLYIDRAQAEITRRATAPDGSWEQITARHNGYARLGVIHQRAVTAFSDGRWQIEDRLLPTSHAPLSTPHTARIHWLLPDWPYELQIAECGIRIHSPHGWIKLTVRGQWSVVNTQLVRAGELLHGDGPISPTWGWVSPTYGVKEPALSFGLTVSAQLPLQFTTEFIFPEAE
jgi:hypothetical protein